MIEKEIDIDYFNRKDKSKVMLEYPGLFGRRTNKYLEYKFNLHIVSSLSPIISPSVLRSVWKY